MSRILLWLVHYEVNWLAPPQRKLGKVFLITAQSQTPSCVHRATATSQIPEDFISWSTHTTDESKASYIPGYIDQPEMIMELIIQNLITELSLFAPPTNKQDQLETEIYLD